MCVERIMVLTSETVNRPRVNPAQPPFVIQCGIPSLVLTWYAVILAAVWALVIRYRAGESLESCPP